MKKTVFLVVIALSTTVFATEHSTAASSFTDVAAKYFAYFIALGLAVAFGTKAQSNAAAVGLRGNCKKSLRRR